ncbi:MAG: hypothetical protein QMC95_15055 [Desulfitobacteriaceae bacterium]|nr:hypothetical protein [Desulfitobacteriaceae bacterium]MDI6915512.1 hypothetical protein [Desulfitobacteriaceae bacterium]
MVTVAALALSLVGCGATAKPSKTLDNATIKIGVIAPLTGTEADFGTRQKLHTTPPHEIVELGISYVPEGRGLFPMTTIRENLLISGHSHRARK